MGQRQNSESNEQLKLASPRSLFEIEWDGVEQRLDWWRVQSKTMGQIATDPIERAEVQCMLAEQRRGRS
jgi:hypothetical protein